jgi:hypothetical protein
MGWGPVLGAVGSLIGGSQARSAARDQQRAAQQGLDFQRGVYRDAQGNLAPYMQYGQGQGGLGGLAQLAAGDYSGFEMSPDYLYSRGEMVKGLDRSAASHSRLNAGGYPVELAGHLNGLASQNLGNYRNSLQWGAGLGQQSAMGLGQLGQAAAGNMMQGYNQMGQAQAAGHGATAGMWGGVLGGLANGLGGGWGQSAYGGGSNANSFGLPSPVDPYANTSWGQSPGLPSNYDRRFG